MTVWTDHEPDPARWLSGCKDAEALVLFRERTAIGADLLERLPNLKLISQRSVYPHVDVDGLHRQRRAALFSTCTPTRRPMPPPNIRLALILASYRQIPQQAGVAAGRATGNRASGARCAGAHLGCTAMAGLRGRLLNMPRRSG